MKRLLLVPAAAICFFFSACGEPEQTETEFFVSPNESSELAILMRDMFDDAMRMKGELEVGKKPTPGVDIERILTAEATEPEKAASLEYKAFAEAYIHVTSQMKEANHAQASEVFDEMVESCITCHQQLCPGPIRKISKLKE